jgi:hypothetical protein
MKPLSIKDLKEVEALMTRTVISMLNDTCCIDEDSEKLYQFDQPSLLKFMQLVTDITLIQVEIRQDEKKIQNNYKMH